MFCLVIDVLLVVFILLNIKVVYVALSVMMALYSVSLLGTKLRI